jgi:hypothetical protein
MKLTDFVKDLGRCVVLFPGLSKAIGREESIFICQMLYWTSDHTAWVWKTAEQIDNETDLSPREQRRVRVNLVRLGLLKEKEIKSEHRIYFKVITDRLNEIWATHAASLGDSRSVSHRLALRESPPSGKSRQSTTLDESTNPPAGAGLVGDRSFEDKCVTKLHKVVLDRTRINKDTRTWRKVFVNMQRFDMITQTRIKAALIWYRDHAGEKYIPVIDDAQSFRRKFASVERAMGGPEEGDLPMGKGFDSVN